MKKLTTSLLVSVFFYGIDGNQLSADDLFSLDCFSYTRYSQHYNTLPSVEEADERLQLESPRFSSFLQKTEELVVRYDLGSHLGLRLIHSHFILPTTAIMSEAYEEIDGIPSLVTYAHTPEEAFEANAFPSSWIFKTAHPEDAQVFEASSDSAVQEGIKLMTHEPEFMTEMANLLADTEFNSLLSLAVLKRNSVEQSHEDQLLVEQNDGPANRSVVQLWEANHASKNMIKTSWSFKGPRQHRCVLTNWCLPVPAGWPHYKQVNHKYTR